MQRDDRLEEESQPQAEQSEQAASPEGGEQAQAPRRSSSRASGSSGDGGGTGTRRRSRASAAPAAAEAPPAEEAAPSTNGAAETPARPRLMELYRTEVVPAMVREFEYSNIMEVPRLNKVVLNIGLGESLTNPRAMESATRDLTIISGQKPIVTRAKKSIAGFKIREGNPIGVAVTLRGIRMYHFMDRLINAALPRIRDFRGVSGQSFDGRGNYSMGIREQIIFPEIDYGQIERIRGFQVTIATSARTDAEAYGLLSHFGMPFVRSSS